MCIKMVTGQWGYVGIYIMYAIQVIFFCIFVSFIWICLMLELGFLISWANPNQGAI